ncbi:hypothetical protein I3843_15G061100, partial [Carya illinoinensis]
MMLREWPPGLSLQEVDLTYSTFWIQIHRLSLELITETNAEKIGLGLNKLLEIDPNSLPTIGPWQFLRLRVDTNTDKCLFDGFSLPRINRSLAKISFKYERFSNFCYGYGSLGHLLQVCPLYFNNDKNRGSGI